MCETTPTEAYENPFSSTITRTFTQNTANIDRKITNDSNVSYKKLCEEAKGIKSDGFCEMTPRIDALHCEINNAVWLKKIFVREIANPRVKKWTYSNREKIEKEQLQEAEERLNKKLRQETGLQKHLICCQWITPDIY